MTLAPFARELLDADPLVAAPRLLNALIAVGERVGRIVEVEAYRGREDPASHAYRGRTPRNATMFGQPGLLYVYFTYGMHFCANVVCWPAGTAGAVLIRAIEPVAGVEAMRDGRPARLADELLGSGPARACRSLGLTRDDDGTDLCAESAPVASGEALQSALPQRARLVIDELGPPRTYLVGPRIGLSERCGKALQWPWRFAVAGSVAVSRPLPQQLRDTPAD